ncbi:MULTISPECIES: glycosyltransferase [unclassified Sporosarcina]|uniref:glycosyltransferase n=1 Tax=unclassified Sporosarcina TaxID=2647733 RepID=UPI0013044D21|nr:MULTISPECIES: glycosyltransferase [unclassified Sporosarcina]
MRVVVNNIAASTSGALSILKSFYKYISSSKVGKEHEWIFLLNDNYIEETENVKVIVLNNVKKSWKNRLEFDFISGKKIITELRPDVVFSLQNTIIYGLDYPQILYMHQAIPFQKEKRFSFLKPEERTLAIYQYLIGRVIKKSIKKADKVVVQTNWIKDAVIKDTNISPKKITAILPPFEDKANRYKSHHPFKANNFFYPAAESLYKNHKCIYEACSILNNKGTKNFEISLTIKNKEDIENISYLGEIPFEEVMYRYNTSTLIFPSYIETVGLPLMEARQIGTLVLAADCAYAREVLQGYENVYFFDPFKPQELAYLLEKVLLKEIQPKIMEQADDKNQANSWIEVIEILIESMVK